MIAAAGGCACLATAPQAQQRAYAGVDAIHWNSEFHRDIGWRAPRASELSGHGRSTGTTQGPGLSGDDAHAGTFRQVGPSTTQ